MAHPHPRQRYLGRPHLLADGDRQLVESVPRSVEVVLEELRAHRRLIRQCEPSLANRAGKHYRRIRELYADAVSLGMGRRAVQATGAQAPLRPPRPDLGQMRAYVVARPHPDLETAMNAILFDLDQGQGVGDNFVTAGLLGNLRELDFAESLGDVGV